MFTTAHDIYNHISQKRHSNYGTKHVKDLLVELGHPENDIKFVHIGGTNGKGSTTNFVRAILQEAGYNVGTFTSPHLYHYNDRIRINNVWIEDKDIVRIYNQYEEIFETYKSTYFEITFAIALLFFKEKNVDIALIEVGLGGRLDATNCIKPICSAITNISLDHTEYLGDTITEIAFEKAGIIKRDTPILTTIEQEEALEVLFDRASILNSEIAVIDGTRYFPYELKTTATYQHKNAWLSLSIIKMLTSSGFNISKQHIETAFKTTIWDGRFQTVNEHPKIIVDGAHNLAGIKALKNSIVKNFPDKDIHILFTGLHDKELESMINELHSITDHLYLTTFDFYRAEKDNQLKNYYHEQFYPNFKEAFQDLMPKMTTHDVFIVTGSLYFISDVLNYYKLT